MVNLGFHHHRKLYKFVNFIHCSWMSYKTYVGSLPLYSDATPSHVGILAPYENKLELFKSLHNFLENEYIGVFISHILRPYRPLLTDNMAVLHLFRKGRFPPSWRQNYKLTKILIETYRIFYIKSKCNPADIVSRSTITYV